VGSKTVTKKDSNILRSNTVFFL